MTDLSPAAQAILDASTSVFWRPLIDVPAFQSKSVAAALEAAADQIIEEVSPVEVLLAIAAELRGQGDNQ